MIIHTYVQGSKIDIYPSGYDLSRAGERLDFSNFSNIPEGLQNCRQFVEQLLNFNPAVAHQLSSNIAFNQQVLDIQKLFESGDRVAIYPENSIKGVRKRKSWLDADSITADEAAQYKAQRQKLNPYRPRVKAVVSEPVEVKTESYDHQLTIEVAGHNLPRNQSLVLSKTATEPAMIQHAIDDKKHTHRSLVNFQHISQNPRKLSLAISMNSEPSPMLLPLTTDLLAPSKSNRSTPEWDNVLIPIKPLRNLSASKKSKQAVELSDGWLYLFWKGKLWRELDVSPEGALRDCRVDWYRGQIRFGLHGHDDIREAEGHWLDNIWLPYKINNEYQLGRNGIRMAFSETQWPWSLIEALESDTESLIAKTTSIDAIKQYSIQQHFGLASNSIDAIEVAMKNRKSDQPKQNGRPSKIATICLAPEPNKVCLKINDHNLSALAGKRYQLIAGNNRLDGILPADGIINEPLPHYATEGELSLWCDSESGSPSHRIPLKLGQLAHIETTEGIQARLNNLNHPAGVIDGITGRKTLSAIKQFQQQNKLAVDGDVGPLTREKLREIHGS